MKYNLRGNYFFNQYHLPQISGINSVEKVITGQSPADTNLTLWQCPVEYKHVAEVIESARVGYKTWKKTKLKERINYMRKFQSAVEEVKDELATAIALETGKPLWEAATEVSSVIAKVDITINESLPRIESKHIPEIQNSTDGHITYKPIGPCIVIGPFNFPCHLPNTQILSALLAGNSVIFKPSEKTCYSTEIFFNCYVKAGLPAGAINLIQGDGEIARRIISDPSIKLVFFTGSKEVGVKILNACANDPTKLIALELGGKNTTILHQDANTDYALEEIIKAAYLTSGQRCTSTSIVAIHQSLAQDFVSRFHDITKKIIIDHPIDFVKEPFMGPLIDEKSLETYLLYVGMAKREGIEEIMRGKKIQKSHHGHYATPSIHLTNSYNQESHFLTSEIFGPTCTFITYDTIDDAINIANASNYGLAASVFTKDQGIYQHCLEEIEAGIINLNRSTCGASARLPFGGIKNSGNYRPAAVAMIDSCVYQTASLECKSDTPSGIDSIKGISLD